MAEFREQNPDAERVAPAKVTEDNLKALNELKKKAEDGDADAIQALIEVTTNFSQWRLSKDRQKAVAKECKDRLEQEEAAVGEAIENPIPIGSTQETFDATRTKLEVIERRWQDLNEVKAANKEKKKSVQASVREWAGKLDRSIQDSAQLTLGRGKVAGFR